MTQIAGKPDPHPWLAKGGTFSYDAYMREIYGEDVFDDPLIKNLRKMVEKRKTNQKK